MQNVRIPRATYRLQFTPTFGFSDALRLLPYLHRLGISHIYASPITRARTGSTHGYDVCDPKTVNPELGTLDEFLGLLHEVARRKMGWLQDIVPNHMAYSHENPYLVDVLEHGRASRYADFFDITWDHQHESLRGRLLAPFLGKPYGQCVMDGELKIIFENGGLWVAYFDQRYPLAPESYWDVLGGDIQKLQAAIDSDTDDYTSLFGALHSLRNLPAATPEQERSAQCSMAKSVIRRLYEQHSPVRRHIEERTREFSTGTPGGGTRFDVLMSKQNFRLAFWKVAAEELNYRRFFTVSDLICIRVEHEYVFEETHSFILGLVEKGLINGLRVDHIDGLFDPAAYLRRLRGRAPEAYIVVEKILDRTERLPSDWPVQGTTGYDFLNHLSYSLCDRESEDRFDTLYAKFGGERVDPTELQIEKKRLIIGKHMAGDIDNLARLVMRIAGVDLMGRDITLYGLRRALVEVLTHFPVYRTYITTNMFTEDDARDIAKALRLSRETMAGLAVEFDFIERFLMVQGNVVHEADFDEAWRSAVMRFQQFTGPLMAKGFEDTLFYVYNRNVALNEVGGWPEQFGINQRDFHRFIADRAAPFPWAMNATATHDTKRGEDTRARLLALTEMPAEWMEQLTSWSRLNARFEQGVDGEIYPDRNDQYLFYQTLVGTLPFDGAIDKAYVNRLEDYMVKAVREAKVHTAWIKPDEDYERAIINFVSACLNVSKNREFIAGLRSFVHDLSWFGIINSISQLVLKLTMPGVPDFYQGTELWDLSLVDPDNRRPVDFMKRDACLRKALKRETSFVNFLESPGDGCLKIFVMRRLLTLREEHPALFEAGDYFPVTVHGTYRKNLDAFTRTATGETILVLVPRLSRHLVKTGRYPLGKQTWQDTRIRLRRSVSCSRMTDVFSGKTIKVGDEVLVGDLFEHLPVAVLRGSSPE